MPAEKVMFEVVTGAALDDWVYLSPCPLGARRLYLHVQGLQTSAGPVRLQFQVYSLDVPPVAIFTSADNPFQAGAGNPAEVPANDAFCLPQKCLITNEGQMVGLAGTAGVGGDHLQIRALYIEWYPGMEPDPWQSRYLIQS